MFFYFLIGGMILSYYFGIHWLFYIFLFIFIIGVVAESDSDDENSIFDWFYSPEYFWFEDNIWHDKSN